MKDAWDKKEWLDGVTHFSEPASSWNHNVVGNIPKNRKALLHRLDGIDKKALNMIMMASSNFKKTKKTKNLWSNYQKLCAEKGDDLV